METLSQLWAKSGEQGVQTKIRHLTDKLTVAQNELSEAKRKRSALTLCGRVRSRLGFDTFQQSRTLQKHHLDTIIDNIEVSEWTLRFEIRYISLKLAYAKRLKLQGVHDFDVFTD